MKKGLVIAFWILMGAATNAQPGTERISIIPQPASVTMGTGSFSLPVDMAIVTGNNEDVKRIAGFLSKTITTVTGNPVAVKEGSGATSKSIFLSLSADKSIPKEGYRLRVGSDGISVIAADPAGVFYGVQTLYQLMPKEIIGKTKVSSVSWTIPAVTIEDRPRFGWRGLMLDVSRHFFTKEEVKEYIDQMARYKFNMLHLHLTDDQG